MLTAALIGVFAAFSYSGTSFQVRGTQHITLDHVFNGTFGVDKHGVRWVPEGLAISIFSSSSADGFKAGDGVFATTRDGNIVLVDLKTNTTRNLVSFMDLKDVRKFICIMIALIGSIGTWFTHRVGRVGVII